MLYRLLDGIWFLFQYQTNLVIVVHLEMESLVFFHNSNLVATGSLSGYDNLYLLDIIASFNESLHVSTIGVKRKLTVKNLASLWHK